MSVGVDFFKSEFLLQAFDTEVVWRWELTDDERAMFYHVAPSPIPDLMDFARVEVTRIIQSGSTTRHRAPRSAVDIHVKLDYAGAADERPTLNLGELNFHAIRVPGN